MRIRIGNNIYICTAATHPTDSKLLILVTRNGIYTVDCNQVTAVEGIMRKLLVDGHYDFSAYEYTKGW